MTKTSGQVSRPAANRPPQRMRKIDSGFKRLLSSCEQTSTEKAIESTLVFTNDKMVPYLRAEGRHISRLLNRDRRRYADCVQFFEGDCVTVVDLVFGAGRRIGEVKALAKELETRSEAEGRWGRATRKRLLGDLEAALARTSELCPDSQAILRRIGEVVSTARVTLEQEAALGLGPLEEATALYWVAFSLYIEQEIRQSDYGSLLDFLNKYADMSAWDAKTKLGRIWSALSERYFEAKGHRDAQAPLRLATKQLQRYSRTSASSVEALELMVSIQRILGRTDALYKAEMDLKRARTTAVSSHALQPQSEVQLDGSGTSFEMKCRRLLEAMGFEARITEVTADGGIDIIATRSEPITSTRYVVQCKNWQNSVGVKIARELYGVVIAEDANKGILITSSEFTSSAIAFAEGKRLELIDGQALESLLSKYRKERK